MHYVMSDLHGSYRAYRKLLEQIQFSEDDTLYVLGDILDRGPEPVKLMFDLMARDNVVCLAGNHEVMALECLHFLMKEISDETIGEMNANTIGMLFDWQRNGGESTICEFCKLSKNQRSAMIDFMGSLDLYYELSVSGANYILVHAGLGNFSPDKELSDYTLDELVWQRADYQKQYFSDRIIVSGHTPTFSIAENSRPGRIYRHKNHIAIDCGAGFGCRLACLCLETGAEFYAEINE